MAETNLAQAVEATNAAAAYDTNVKFLLADKQILSWILKYTIREFQDMTLEEITGCIGDKIEVAAVPVDPGLTNLGRMQESLTEDNIPGEGVIRFDIRFQAYHRDSEMKFLINIEAQKSSDPGKLGYHLENRIVFYLARMISAQKFTEFHGSNYDDLKKVRSIWICMDNQENGDSIEELQLVRKMVFGPKQESSEMDLMQGIIINIRDGENIEPSRNILIAMLEHLLSRVNTEEKKRILEEEYGMIMTVELERRMQTMCNLSENILEKGKVEGELNCSRSAIIDLLEDLGEIPEDICSMINTEERTDTLRLWLKAAARAKSIEEFQSHIEKG